MCCTTNEVVSDDNFSFLYKRLQLCTIHITTSLYFCLKNVAGKESEGLKKGGSERMVLVMRQGEKWANNITSSQDSKVLLN
jgi:hypothetical protein